MKSSSFFVVVRETLMFSFFSNITFDAYAGRKNAQPLGWASQKFPIIRLLAL
jgi:hypothetical protein